MSKNSIDLDSSTLYRCNQKYYDKVLSEYGLGYSQFIFLSSILENEGMMMNELAQNGSFDKGSITKAIAKLEEQGFVSVESSEEDKRTKKLFTTEKTRELMPKLFTIRQEWLNYLSEEISEEELDSFTKVMNKLLNKVKAYSTTELNDKDDLKFYGFQKLTLLDYPGCMAATLFTGGCNLRCPFCHNKGLVYLNEQEKLNTADIKDYLLMRRNVLDGICISGGEPLLHEGLENFLKEVKEIGLKVKLDTNGTNFEKLKKFVEEGLVDYVAMDIKNTKELYPLTTGIENVDIKTIEKSVNYLKENHVDYEFRTTLVKEFHEKTNYKDLGEWLKGAKNYYLQNFEDHGSCIKEGLHALEKEKILEIQEELKPYVENVGIRGISKEGE